MRTDIIDHCQSEVLSRCKKPTNKFGMGCYYHIESVVQNAALLSEKFGADKEIVIIASWLHDIASVTDYSMYEEHHIYGARIAGELLGKFDYDPIKIQAVQNCIRNHRGSVPIEKQSNEEICVADADAISHFDNIPSLLYLAYVTKGMDFEKGKQFVIDKLNRTYRKLSDRSKLFYKDKYQNSMALLNTSSTMKITPSIQWL